MNEIQRIYKQQTFHIRVVDAFESLISSCFDIKSVVSDVY